MIKLSPRLQSTDPSRALREQPLPAVSAEPEQAPADVAETALLAAQVAAWEVEATEAVLDVADDWFTSHAGDHRLYRQAVERRRLIEAQWCIQQRLCWTACCQLYGALAAMMASEAWIAQNAPEIDAETMETIWGSLMGERLVPFGVVYPVAGRLPVPAWQRDELSERRDRQRAKAVVIDDTADARAAKRRRNVRRRAA